MNRELLKALKNKLQERWNEIYHQCVLKSPTKQLGRATSQWRGTCNALNIQPLDESHDYEPGGQILEELVIVPDPNPAGMWLEMTHETAMKILTAGFP